MLCRSDESSTKYRTLKLTPALRSELKKPLGTLVKGSPQACVKKLRSLVRGCSKLITIGDVVTACVIKAGAQPDLQVIDHRVMRKVTKIPLPQAQRVLHLRNPPGMLMRGAWEVIEDAMKVDLKTRVIVQGEEDLLTLPAVLLAPEGSLVVYGQPAEGLVFIEVTRKAKETCQQIVKKMEEVDCPSK